MNNKIKIVLVIIIFAGGWILGSNNNTAPVITSSMGGASYSGGYQPEAQAAVPEPHSVPWRLSLLQRSQARHQEYLRLRRLPVLPMTLVFTPYPHHPLPAPTALPHECSELVKAVQRV